MSKKTRMKTLPTAMDGFIDDGWIEEVVSVVKSGKEATVYCCRACAGIGREYVAAKYFRSRENRGFKNDAIYQEGRGHGKHREARAYANKTRFGREIQQMMWTGAEFETLQILHAAGALVPEPLASAGDAILMEYVGDDALPGRPLYALDVAGAEAREYCDLLLDQIALWLRHHRIHGDLSPYNVLHTESRGLCVIDFPQAVDPRKSPHARMLLQRDVENVVEFFKPYGVRTNAERHVGWLWNEWKLGRL